MIPKREDYNDGPQGLLAYSFSLEECLRASNKKLEECRIRIQELEADNNLNMDCGHPGGKIDGKCYQCWGSLKNEPK